MPPRKKRRTDNKTENSNEDSTDSTKMAKNETEVLKTIS